MEDRLTPTMYIETSTLGADDYARTRVADLMKCPGVDRASWWQNASPNRDKYPLTMDEFSILGVYEVTEDFRLPDPVAGIGSHHFRRYPRPAQGSLSGLPTNGILLVWISPKTPEGAQPLRDWSDFIHLRHIAEAAVPGYGMITAYESTTAGSPRYMHFYEMHTEDPNSTFASMSPRVKARIGEAAYPGWLVHDELVMNYVNTFSLLGSRTL
jgi:hypothetical protein